MLETDVVLSDVHIDVLPDDRSGKVTSTKFYYNKEATFENDDDGDLIVSRKKCFNIRHAMATTLPDVGQQVWRGALLMCDFVMENSNLFETKDILELGCGVGVTGIVLGMHSQSTTCTDYTQEILDICQYNLQSNNITNATTKLLDWSKELADIDGKSIRYPNIIVACEVVYSNELTDLFFATLLNIISKPKVFVKTKQDKIELKVFISLEKRINFTIPELCETAKEYDHFVSCLKAFQGNLHSRNFSCVSNQIDITGISQYFIYQRVNELELWSIDISNCNKSF